MRSVLADSRLMLRHCMLCQGESRCGVIRICRL